MAGRQIVDALALDRGWHPEPDGKTVWVDVPTRWPEPPPSDKSHEDPPTDKLS